MNRILSVIFLVSLLSLHCMSQETSSPVVSPGVIAVTNRETALQVAWELRKLWPRHAREYFETFNTIMPYLGHYERDMAATQVTQHLVDEVLALPTTSEEMGDTPPDIATLAEWKGAMEKSLFLATFPSVRAVTNLATAVQMAQEMQALWPERGREYRETFKHVMTYLVQHESEPIAKETIQTLFDTIISLQTVYEQSSLNIPPPDSLPEWYQSMPYRLLGWKEDMVKYFFSHSKDIKTNPDRWLELAGLIGELKGEIRPELRRAMTRSSSFNPSLTDLQREMIRAEDSRRIALANYQNSLAVAIQSLTMTLVWSGLYVVKFDDDAQWQAHKENLIRLAQLSEENVKRLDERKR